MATSPRVATGAVDGHAERSSHGQQPVSAQHGDRQHRRRHRHACTAHVRASDAAILRVRFTYLRSVFVNSAYFSENKKIQTY